MKGELSSQRVDTQQLTLTLKPRIEETGSTNPAPCTMPVGEWTFPATWKATKKIPK